MGASEFPWCFPFPRSPYSLVRCCPHLSWLCKPQFCITYHKVSLCICISQWFCIFWQCLVFWLPCFIPCLIPSSEQSPLKARSELLCSSLGRSTNMSYLKNFVGTVKGKVSIYLCYKNSSIWVKPCFIVPCTPMIVPPLCWLSFLEPLL